jgi:hypothetical protein
MHGFCTTIESPNDSDGWEEAVMKRLTEIVNGISKADKDMFLFTLIAIYEAHVQHDILY